jgi:hypothetical protein
MNICKNCMYYEADESNAEASRCGRKTLFSPVTGKIMPIYCNTERLAWGTCKPEGIHFKLPMTQEELDADREIKSREWERWVGPGDRDYERFNRKLGL